MTRPPKYSAAELGARARRALAERDRATPDWVLLLLLLCARTDTSPDVCIRRLSIMAGWH